MRPVVGFMIMIVHCAEAASTRRPGSGRGGTPGTSLPVFNNSRLPPTLPGASRTELASVLNPSAMYKPYLALLPATGELIALAFCGMGWSPGQCRPFGNGTVGNVPEHAVLWRSTDSGVSWGESEDRPDLLGREFSLNALSDGTLLAPFVTADDRLKGAVPAGLYRSTDGGRTFGMRELSLPGVSSTLTEISWSVIELPDKKTLMGLSGNYDVAGNKFLNGSDVSNVTNVFWMSTDSGASWNTSYMQPDVGGWRGGDMFFGQATSTRLKDGTLLHGGRLGTAATAVPPAPLDVAFDEYDGMYAHRSTDNARSWQCIGCREGAADHSITEEHVHPDCAGLPSFGAVGEMYPRFLELQDGRVLLTFTVRCGQDVLPPTKGPNSTRMCASGTAPTFEPGVCYYSCNRTVDGHGLGLRAVLSTE